MNQATRITALAVALAGAVLGALSCAILLELVAAPTWLSREELGVWVLAYLVVLVLAGDPSRPNALSRMPGR